MSTISIGTVSADAAKAAEALISTLGGRTGRIDRPRGGPAQNAQAERGEEAARAITREDAAAMTEEINDIMSEMHNGIRFRVCEDGGEVVVQIIDRETDEVIREMPSEDLLNAREKFNEALGIIFDEKR